MNPLHNLKDQRFGRLVVQSYLGNQLWECLCDCGTLKVVHSKNIKTSTRSCGCLKKENNRLGNRERAAK